jgi:mannose/fructose/N-acetylgalactosamine-specific phosphotransferase system component IIB
LQRGEKNMQRRKSFNEEASNFQDIQKEGVQVVAQFAPKEKKVELQKVKEGEEDGDEKDALIGV